MARKHTVDEVLRTLKTKKDVRVSGKTVAVLSNKVLTNDGRVIINPDKTFDLGNKSWGKIDYLCNHCGYHLWITYRF